MTLHEQLVRRCAEFRRVLGGRVAHTLLSGGRNGAFGSGPYRSCNSVHLVVHERDGLLLARGYRSGMGPVLCGSHNQLFAYELSRRVPSMNNPVLVAAVDSCLSALEAAQEVPVALPRRWVSLPPHAWNTLKDYPPDTPVLRAAALEPGLVAKVDGQVTAVESADDNWRAVVITADSRNVVVRVPSQTAMLVKPGDFVQSTTPLAKLRRRSRLPLNVARCVAWRGLIQKLPRLMDDWVPLEAVLPVVSSGLTPAAIVEDVAPCLGREVPMPASVDKLVFDEHNPEAPQSKTALQAFNERLSANCLRCGTFDDLVQAVKTQRCVLSQLARISVWPAFVRSDMYVSSNGVTADFAGEAPNMKAFTAEPWAPPSAAARPLFLKRALKAALTAGSGDAAVRFLREAGLHSDAGIVAFLSQQMQGLKPVEEYLDGLAVTE